MAPVCHSYGSPGQDRGPGHYLEVRQKLHEQRRINRSQAVGTVTSLRGIELKRNR